MSVHLLFVMSICVLYSCKCIVLLVLINKLVQYELFSWTSSLLNYKEQDLQPTQHKHVFRGEVSNDNLFCDIRGLSVKYEDTVNTEANTSNNMELFLFVLLRTIWQFIYEFSFQYVNSEIKYYTFLCSGVLGAEHCVHVRDVFGYYHTCLQGVFNSNTSM